MATRVRAPVRGLAEGEVRLEAELSHYLARVLRLAVGDVFTGFDPERAEESEGRLVRDDGAGGVTVIFGPLRPAEVRAARAITWLQGLAKGDKCDAIVRDATELGATRIVMVKTARSIVKLEGSRGDAREKRWERIAEEAARQCGRGDPPEVSLADGLEAACRALAPDAARFFLYERATAPLGPRLAEALRAPAGLAFAVGPEGGFTEAELATAERHAFASVSLGKAILRTETVAAAVLGACLVHGQEPS